MSVRRMTLEDLRRLLDWAAAEGWNPGLEDAEAFYTADPEGFFLKEVDGRPVAAVSVVNHTPDFAFLGLYIAAPEARGMGYGMEVWQAGLAHAGSRCVGLDGVPAQQENYRRSGFRFAGKTVRHGGYVERSPTPLARLSEPSDLPGLLELDRKACGLDRTRFASAWLTNSATRQTVILRDSTGFATFRACCDGLKVGPFFAPDRQSAEALLASLPASLPEGRIFIDVPDCAEPLAGLLEAKGLTPVFETARMYRPAAPDLPRPAFYATATLELG